MADTKISGLTAAAEAALTNELPINEGGTSKKVTIAQIGQAMGGVVYAAPGADTAINSTSDVTITTQNITTAVGDQLTVDAWFTILNNSTATRVITLTLDFDALFDIEIATGSLATSTTLMHPMRLHAVLDIRASNLAYAMVYLDTQLAAGIASGTDTTVAATMLQNFGWGTNASDASGTTTVSLFARSANATATQTLRLHHLTIRRVTP